MGQKSQKSLVIQQEEVVDLPMKGVVEEVIEEEAQGVEEVEEINNNSGI